MRSALRTVSLAGVVLACAGCQAPGGDARSLASLPPLDCAVMVTGATDSAQLRAKGVNAYGIEPAGTDEDLKRMHGNDERLGVEALGQFVEFEYAAVEDVAGAK